MIGPEGPGRVLVRRKDRSGPTRWRLSVRSRPVAREAHPEPRGTTVAELLHEVQQENEPTGPIELVADYEGHDGAD